MGTFLLILFIIGLVYFIAIGIVTKQDKRVIRSIEMDNAKKEETTVPLNTNIINEDKEQSSNIDKAKEWYNIALMYDNDGDKQKAVELYIKACNENYPQACHNLATMYRNGHGVQQNYKKAFELFSKALSISKEPLTYFSLAQLYDEGFGVIKNTKKAIELYELSSEGGYVNANYSLAVIYYNGDLGKKDKSKAKLFFKKACDGGNSKACDLYNRLENQGY
jgi:TPR repeat protein